MAGREGNPPDPAPEAVLFRCPAPTDLLCPCGRAARSLRAAGVAFETRRVPLSRGRRPGIVELTGQDRVPVLVHGDEIVHESGRIVEYVEREWGSGKTR